MNVVECKTADDVRALAHRYNPRPATPVVRLPTRLQKPAEPIAIAQVLPPPVFMSYGVTIHVSFGSVLPAQVNKVESRIRLRLRTILLVTANYFGIDEREITAERREARIVHARHVGMWLSKKLTTKSLPEIGRAFGGKDHTSVLHAVRKIEKQLADDPELVGAVHDIKLRLGAV